MNTAAAVPRSSSKGRRRVSLFLFVLLALITLSLAATSGHHVAGVPEALAQGRTPPPLPDGAIAITQDEQRAFMAAGNWSPTSATRDRRAEAKATRQDRKDLRTIRSFARKNGLRVTDLVPPDPPADDPNTVPTEDGNFLHRILLPDRTERQVITYGRRWFLRTVANNIRVFPKKENQLNLYQGLYEGLPERWKTQLSLPDPDQARAFSRKRLEALNRSLANPDVASAIIQDLQAVEPPPPPPGFLTDCDQEVGAGNGGDRDLACADTPGPGGIVANHTWTLKPFITCIKAQAGRGTCTGFANTSAIETLVWKTHGVRVNLSEQAYYNRARTKWDNPANFGDGHTSEIGFREMQKEGFLLFFEDQWNYNPSLSRTANKTTQTYQNSCVGYGETCSDTVHQSQQACVLKGDVWVCGYFVPEKNPGSEGYRIGSSAALWDKANRPLSLAWMQLLLAMGRPLVLGHPVLTAWDAAAAGDGFMPYPALDPTCFGVENCPDAPPGPIAVCSCYLSRGGHGTNIVGFITNATLQGILPAAPPGDGGGYFIVKNSWGNCAGDGGFIYVPFQSIIDHAGDVTVLYSVQ
jgi:hypothetical protein